MANQLHIAIIGYGIAGIATAIQLRRSGHLVEHFERADSVQPTGGGLLLHPPTLKLLQELGVLDRVLQRGAHVAHIHGETLHGRRLMSLRYADHAGPGFAIGTQRRALIDILGDADRGREQLRLAHRIVSVDPDQGSLRDGNQVEHGPYDLIIAADGANSSIRPLFPTLIGRDREYPWAALVCLVADPDSRVSDHLMQHFDTTRHVSFWPVGSNARDAPRLVNTSIKTTSVEATPGQTLDQWKPRMAALCPSLVPILDRAADDTPMWPYRYRDVSLHRCMIGRLVFIGDAAHSMSPQLGQGARMALEDARALSTSLEQASSPATALALFDQRRRAHVARYQRLSRWLTPLFQSESQVLSRFRDQLCATVSGFPWPNRKLLALLCDERSSQTG